jgi:hypothetical protein
MLAEPGPVSLTATLSRSASHADIQRQRSASTGVPLEVSKTISAPLTASSVPLPANPAPPVSHLPQTRRWRLWSLLSSSSRDSSQTNVAHQETAEETVEEAREPEAPMHRKGDVVCLSYDTLDDRGMRKLEGRSDHRPVMGCYAIYI